MQKKSIKSTMTYKQTLTMLTEGDVQQTPRIVKQTGFIIVGATYCGIFNRNTPDIELLTIYLSTKLINHQGMEECNQHLTIFGHFTNYDEYHVHLQFEDQASFDNYHVLLKDFLLDSSFIFDDLLEYA
jgi:3-isopropylmalate dehydratase small subunit